MRVHASEWQFYAPRVLLRVLDGHNEGDECKRSGTITPMTHFLCNEPESIVFEILVLMANLATVFIRLSHFHFLPQRN